MTDQPGASEINFSSQENKETDPLLGFGENVQGMVDYFRNNISSKINPDGSFIDKNKEREAIQNWKSWYHAPSLPTKTEENKDTWMQEMEQAMKNPYQVFHYADRPLLIEYYERKHPNQKSRIKDIFASFDHDLNLISSGIDASFSEHEEDRIENAAFRKQTLLQWPTDLLEAAAQEFKNEYPKEQFDFAQDLNNLKELFNIVTPSQQYNVEIEINDVHHKGTDISGNRLSIKKSIYNMLRNVHKKTSTTTFYKNIVTLTPTNNELAILIQDNAGGFRGEDAKLIEVDSNTPQYNRKNGYIIPKPKVFELGEKGISSTGTGRGLHTVWKTIVDLHNGVLTVSNIERAGNKVEPLGARFTVSIPYKQTA